MQKIFFSILILSFLTTGIGLIGILSGSYGVKVLAQNSDLLAVSEVELPSPGITPDSPFYFLKSWKESIQTFFTFGAENKAEQYLHLAEVRLAEYQKMIEKDKTEIAQKTLEKYEKQLNQALEKSQEAKEKGKDVEKLVTLISEKTLKHQEVLSGILEKVPDEAKKGIENAIEMSKKGYETAIEAVSEIKKERERMKKECLEEGETYMPGDDRQCCAGLKGISLSVGDGRICSLTAGYVCTAFCGDGKCQGEYENACSCLEDCPKSEKEEISCTTNSDCGADTCQQGRDKCVEIKYVCENGECSGTSKEYKNYSCARYYYGSINFTGGTILEVEYKKVRPETRVIAEKFTDLFESISIQPTGEKGIILKMKHVDEITHQQILQKLGEVEEKHFESVRGTIDYSKCVDTCGDDICRLPETKDWCPEDCSPGSGQEPTEEGPVVGGPCSYNTLKGKCEITSILNENVIKFRFIPTEPLILEGIEWVKKVIDREYEEYAGYLGLKCLDKYPITKENLEKCNIKENAIFDCELSVITSGTCTPINFKFY